jgi:hypothetical protein
MQNIEIEQYYFDLFRRHYQLPAGKITHGDKPDVILHADRTIGIEITNFFLEDGSLPHSEQVQRKARDFVVSRAQEIYLENGGKNIEVSFSFDNEVPIREKNRVAQKIADLAKHIDSHESGSIDREVFSHIPELDFLYVNPTEYEDPKWQLVQCYSGQVMSMDGLRRIVRTKEEQSKGYSSCNEYWLLVVIDFMDRAQDQEIVDSTQRIESGIFEKVIVYKTCFGTVYNAK